MPILIICSSTAVEGYPAKPDTLLAHHMSGGQGSIRTCEAEDSGYAQSAENSGDELSTRNLLGRVHLSY